MKNRKQQKIFLKLPRSEFIDAKQNGVKLVRFSPTQECQGNNVFNLGDGIGYVRIETESVDFSTAPRYEEGVHL